MARQVAIIDAVPSYRRGLTVALEEAGFRACEPDDVVAWTRARVREGISPRPAVLLTVHGPDEFRLITEVHLNSVDIVVVALLPDPTATAFHEALSAGAAGAVAYTATGDVAVAVLQAALVGDSRLPLPIARSFAAGWGDRRRHPARITERDVRWLRALASGWTVVRLANAEGYSRREMFRQLNDMYERLGVTNRHEAVAQAANCRLLDRTERQPHGDSGDQERHVWHRGERSRHLDEVV